MNQRESFKLALLLANKWTKGECPRTPDAAVDEALLEADNLSLVYTHAELLEACASAAEVVEEEVEE